MKPIELGSWSYPRGSMEPGSPARWKFPECAFLCVWGGIGFLFPVANKADGNREIGRGEWRLTGRIIWNCEKDGKYGSMKYMGDSSPLILQHTESTIFLMD